jgi:flagellar biosynthetic protein FliR
MLASILPNEPFVFFLIFARIGGALMVMPAFGERQVPARMRLMLALVITLVVSPVLMDTLPGAPESPWALFILLGGEIVVGLFMGTLARLLISALSVAGQAISFQMSLANAFFADPAFSQQSSLPANFLMTLALLLIFVTNLHHMLLRAVINSYGLFVPGAALPVEDFAGAIVDMIAESFLLALQLASPFLVVGLLLYLGLGLLGRLMPQVQVFFVAMPLQIALGLTVMAITVSVLVLWFLDRFQELYFGLFVVG